jgi:GntR family transcriptional regulator
VSRMPEGRTTWRDIADDLRAAITSGEYAPGARVPSRSKLMARYGVATQTVNNAINTLRAEGLIVGRQGSGWYVRSQRPVMRLARNRLARSEREAGRGTFMSDAQLGDWTPRTEVEIRTESASDDVAVALGIEPGAPVLVRDRLMYADDEPVQLATSRFPAELTTGTAIEQDNTGPGGVYARLEEAGHHLEHFEECVRIGVASEHEAALLSVPVGAPVFRITRVAYTQDRAVEINHIVANGDRYELHYALPAE